MALLKHNDKPNWLKIELEEPNEISLFHRVFQWTVSYSDAYFEKPTALISLCIISYELKNL